MTDSEKPTCFVIQAFDGAKYDRRYKETIRPALIKAGVEPQRADEILGLNPVIEKIEGAIDAASICVAEVTEDNPNVWLELGYALALRRPTVILCDKSLRARLPFDVQHRPVVFYRTDSRSGYEELEQQIVSLVQHELRNEQRIAQAPTLKAGTESATDLEPYEVAILATALAFWPTAKGSVSHWDLENKLKRDSYTDVAVALGITSLIAKNLLVEREFSTEDSNGDFYVEKTYQITPDGISWVRSHESLLTLTAPKAQRRSAIADALDDDIPF